MARGKFNKRGGGPRFHAESGEEIDIRSARLAELDDVRAQRRADDSDGEEGNGGESKEGEDKKGGEAELIKPPKIENLDVGAQSAMNRKEREEKEKEAAKEAYRKKHEAGLTEEYARDMAKLNEVRARREKMEARAKIEKEITDSLEEERKQKSAAAQAAFASEEEADKKKKKAAKKAGAEMPKLDKISIKKMKPAAMKEALNERGLPIQGNAKELTDRLIKYEENR